MDQDLFSQFTAAVCREILFSPARKGIAAELAAHLEDAADALTERGMPEEEARAAAVAAMGDPARLGKALHRQHWPILGWIEVLWPVALLILLTFYHLVLPHLPDTLYLRLAGVDPDEIVYYAPSYQTDRLQQYGVYVTKENGTYHFWRTGGQTVTRWLPFIADKVAKVTCHVSYNTVTGKIVRYIETPRSCIVDYETNQSADYVHLRYAWMENFEYGHYHMGLMPADEIDGAWDGDLYQDMGNGLILFAGFENVRRWSESYPMDVPFYDYSLVE